MSPTPKIRVALIGLSASAKTSWAANAHLQYLLSPLGSAHYELVTLLNSSVAAAEAAKKQYDLPLNVRAYGDPSALAADPDVDLVVCNTRGDVHYPTTEPSLRAGKAVFIEWPLTENLQRTLELTKGQEVPDSIVGLQGRAGPVTLRTKELLSAGTVGTVLSSEIKSYGNLLERDSLISGLSYFADRKIGSHEISIPYGHMIDYVHEVLGEFDSFQSRLQIQRPELKLVDKEGKQIGAVTPDVPDFLAVHGALKADKPYVTPSATLVATFRHGQPFKGEPGFIWTINGTKGELRITAPGPYLMAHSFDGPIKFDFHDFEKDEVVDLGWDWEPWQKELPLLARSVAVLYERYAEWVEGGKGEVKEGRDWPRLHDAVVRARELDALYKQYDPEW